VLIMGMPALEVTLAPSTWYDLSSETTLKREVFFGNGGGGGGGEASGLPASAADNQERLLAPMVCCFAPFPRRRNEAPLGVVGGRPPARKTRASKASGRQAGGSFCGGNRLAQRVRRRCSSAAKAGC
jgi:hypothetical protein